MCTKDWVKPQLYSWHTAALCNQLVNQVKSFLYSIQYATQNIGEANPSSQDSYKGWQVTNLFFMLEVLRSSDLSHHMYMNDNCLYWYTVSDPHWWQMFDTIVSTSTTASNH